MNDDQLGQLYRAAMSGLAAGQPSASAARLVARRRQRTRRAAGSAVAALAAAALLVGIPASFGGRGLIAAPPVAGNPKGGTATCPALLPGTSDGTTDYANLFIWDETTYLDSTMLDDKDVEPPRLDRQVGTITCSITELTADNGNQVASTPWPDGTATVLATGTRVYSVVGAEPRCGLAVKEGTMVKLFVAVTEPDWTPVC